MDRGHLNHALAVQKFAIEGGPWPLTKENMALNWRNELEVQHRQQELIDEIINSWDPETITDASEWEIDIGEGDEECSNGDEYTNFYEFGGFDEFGFNREGYN